MNQYHNFYSKINILEKAIMKTDCRSLQNLKNSEKDVENCKKNKNEPILSYKQVRVKKIATFDSKKNITFSMSSSSLDDVSILSEQ